MDEIRIPAALLCSKTFSSDEKLILAMILAHERAMKAVNWNGFEYPYSKTAGKIGAQIGLSRTSVNRLLNKLSKDGWIVTTPYPKNWTRETVLTNQFYQELEL
ncbi:MAG: MarR family transcriptional regulator [Flavobacteriales bacterium]|nr:MarR family transcriptional regulator [Flavobacteriales bacterium]